MLIANTMLQCYICCYNAATMLYNATFPSIILNNKGANIKGSYNINKIKDLENRGNLSNMNFYSLDLNGLKFKNL